MTVHLTSYRGAGQYTLTGDDAEAGPRAPNTQMFDRWHVTGTLTVAHGQRSGSVNARFAAGGVTITVTGVWDCTGLTSSPVTTDLSYGAPINVHVTSLARSPACRPDPSKADQLLYLKSADSSWEARLEFTGYDGPGTYQLTGIGAGTFQTQSATTWSQLVTGTVTIDEGEQTGRLAASFSGDAGDFSVRGTWSCTAWGSS